MIQRAIVRRLAGTALAVLLIASGLLAIRNANGPKPDTIRVHAVLGTAGAGLNQGTDVKVRGVRIGKVVGIDFVDGEATALLELDVDPRLPDASVIDLVVSPKTFLGEKQVELDFPDERFEVAPFLQAGDTIRASGEPTEVQAVIDAIEPFFEAMDPDELAAVIEAFGAQAGEGERIARNIELGRELAEFGARTSEDQLARLRDLADVAEALAPRASDFNRLNRSLPRWVSLLPDRQAEVRANLSALSSFAVGFSEFLEVEEADIDTLMVVGDLVGAVFERRAEQVGEIIYGLYRYGNAVGHHGGPGPGDTEYGFFRAFIHGGDLMAEICGAFGGALPTCSGT